MSFTAEDDVGKLKELNQRNYYQQAQFFLNAYWEERGEKESETVWKCAHKMIELDEKRGKEGCELEELTAHRFLESSEETLTVRELRTALREIDIDTNKKVSLSEYLIYRYKVDWHHLVNAPQGSKEGLEQAQKMLSDAQSALHLAQKRTEEARQAEVVAKTAEGVAKRAAADAKEKETASKVAEVEAQSAKSISEAAASDLKAAQIEVEAAEQKVKAALAVVREQEDTYNSRTKLLQQRSGEGGIVSRNKAKHELEQHLGCDPLPLKRAKITQEAAVRAAEKVTKVAAEATDKAKIKNDAAKDALEHASSAARNAERTAELALRERDLAEEATRTSVQKKIVADGALKDAQESFVKAEEFLEEAAKVVPQGSIWWLKRELDEAKKYLPQSKGGGARR